MTSLSGTLNLYGVSGTGTLYLTPPNPNQLINSAGGPGGISPAPIAIAVSGGVVTTTSLYGNDVLLPQRSTYNVRYVASDGTVLTGTWEITGTSFDVGAQVLATSGGMSNFNTWYNPAAPSISFQAVKTDGTQVTGQVILS